MSYKTHRTCTHCHNVKPLEKFSTRGKTCFDCKWDILFENDLRRAEERLAHFTARVAYIKNEIAKRHPPIIAMSGRDETLTIKES